MNKASQDSNAQELFKLMMHTFNLGDLRVLFFDLKVDWEGVPQPATRQDYILYLLHFFASRQQQTILIRKLKKTRSRVNWPKTYNFPTKIDAPDTHNIKIGKYIRNQQNVNITVNQLRQRRPYNKQNKAERIKDVEQDLFEKIFKHTRKFVIILIFVPLFIFVVPLLFIGSSKETFDIVVLIAIPLSFVAFIFPPKAAFSYIYDQIKKTTSFYDLTVNHRDRVKGKLLKRQWGNKFWDFACRSFIRFFLQTNKNKANKISKIKF
ncbi:MAG: hypothetical protein GY805_28935 [Chloroflexi bacterium]|nr:hypothetical protein [Chloroflexota bacterium]